jgi:hypothetical protein
MKRKTAVRTKARKKDKREGRKEIKDRRKK